MAQVLNIIISLAVAFFMWWGGVWAAGDAKLFTLYAVMVPAGLYIESPLPFFPSFSILYNTFLVTVIYLFAELAVREGLELIRGKRPSLTPLKELRARAPNLFLTLLRFLILFFSIRFLRGVIREEVNAAFHLEDSTIYLLLFLFFKPLNRFLRLKVFFIPLLLLFSVSLSFRIFFGGGGHYLSGLPANSLFVFSILIGRWVYDHATWKRYTKVIKMEELAPGMVISERGLRGLMEKGEGMASLLKGVTADGLTHERAEKIKSRFHSEEEIEITSTFPFSLFMGVGVLFTLLPLP